MKRDQIEQQFLGLIDGSISEEGAKLLRSQIAGDPQLQASFEAYARVVATEKEAASDTQPAHPSFVVKVMDRLDEADPGLLRRMVMKWKINRYGIMASLATVATAVLVVKLGSQTAVETRFERVGSATSAAFTGSVDADTKTSGPVVATPTNVPQENRERYSDLTTAFRSDLGKVSQEIKEKNEVSKKLDSTLGEDKRGRSTESASLRVQDEIEKEELEVFGFSQPAAVPPAPSAAAENARKALDSMSSYKRTDVPHGTVAINPTSPGPFRAQASAHQEGDASRAKRYADSIAFGSSQQENYAGTGLAPGLPSTYDHALNRPEGAERYLASTENPRTLVADEPISTFSIDVDTGSYTNARRFLSQGQLPPQDSIRVEEFINYFHYNYPAQHEQPFTVSYEIAPSPLEPKRMLMKVGVKARDARSSETPWNLVFLIDVSGSMAAPNKLELVKQSLKILANNMRPGDKISIVTYAGTTGVALQPTGIENKERIISVINSLGAGGSTNGSGGIEAAYTLAKQSFIQGGVNRVVLATDGDFNVGVTNQNELVRVIEEKRKLGITLTTLGFGEGNYREDIMEQLANKGNGNYFYIDSFHEARKVFETDLFGTMEVVAKDVKLQLEFNPQNVIEYRLIGYENRKLKKEEFSDDRIDAGEIGSGHTVTAIYEITFANSELAKEVQTEYRYQQRKLQSTEPIAELSGELGFLKVRFKQPDGDTSQLLTFPIEQKDIRESVEKSSDDFRFAAAVSYFGQILRGSQFVGNYSLTDIANLAEKARGADKEGYRREFIELVKSASAIRN